MKINFYNFLTNKKKIKKLSYLLADGKYTSPIFSKGSLFIRANAKLPDHLKKTKLQNYLSLKNLKVLIRGCVFFINDIIGSLTTSFIVNKNNNSNYEIVIASNQSDFVLIDSSNNKVMRILNDNIDFKEYVKKRKEYELYINSVQFDVESYEKKQIVEPLVKGQYIKDLNLNDKIKNIRNLLKKFLIYSSENQQKINDEILTLQDNILMLLNQIELIPVINQKLIDIDFKKKITDYKYISSHTDLSNNNMIFLNDELLVIDFPYMKLFPTFYDPFTMIFLTGNDVYFEFLSGKFNNELYEILECSNKKKIDRKLRLEEAIIEFIVFHAFRKVTQLDDQNINACQFKKNIMIAWEKWYLHYKNKNKIG